MKGNTPLSRDLHDCVLINFCTLHTRLKYAHVCLEGKILKYFFMIMEIDYVRETSE